MKAILAGGGRFDLDTERWPTLIRALAMAGSEPKLLVIPTPLKWAPFDELEKLESRLRAAKIKFKLLTTDTQAVPDYDRAKELIAWSSVILVLGGNFMQQMIHWRQNGIDELLISAAPTKVLVGSSTGMMCWFELAHTNTHELGYTGPSHRDYRLEPALGIIPAIACPHYDGFQMRNGTPRAESFRAMISRRTAGTIGIGLTHHAEIIIDGNEVRFDGTDRYATAHILKSSPTGLETTIYRAFDATKLSFTDVFGRAS